TAIHSELVSTCQSQDETAPLRSVCRGAIGVGIPWPGGPCLGGRSRPLSVVRPWPWSLRSPVLIAGPYRIPRTPWQPGESRLPRSRHVCVDSTYIIGGCLRSLIVVPLKKVINDAG